MSLVRHKTNPFLEDMVLTLREKQIRLSTLGKDSDVTLRNEKTGESFGTHLVTHRLVDSEQFLKLFTRNVALTFDLSNAGVKSFNVLCWSVQSGALLKDEVTLDDLTRQEFLEAHKEWDPPLKLSIATFKRGLTELEKSKLIAKTQRPGRYFENPNFIFNGDRVAFSTVIERKKPTFQEQAEAQGQQRLVE